MYKLFMLPLLLPLLAQVLPAEEPPLIFDKSLQELEREGAISIKESQQLRQGDYPQRSAPGQRYVPNLEKLCSSGVMSQRECARAKGVAFVAKNKNAKFGGPDGLPLAPLSVPVSALLVGGEGSFSLSQVFRITPRPAPLLGNGNRSLIFPLIGSAVTSSDFGWRMHPILGSMILHAGKDLAAPEGTPVVAALAGKVVSAGLAGGYGIAVELEHRNPQRRTLYGHLSELFVQSGEQVRQGEVIGRVGSTGLSTGPHLHFELRRPDAGGWVAVDPGSLSPSGALSSKQDLLTGLFDQLLKGLERKT